MDDFTNELEERILRRKVELQNDLANAWEKLSLGHGEGERFCPEWDINNTRAAKLFTDRANINIWLLEGDYNLLERDMKHEVI